MNASSSTDLYVKITEENGKSHIRMHRAWDAPRLLKRLQEDGAKDGQTVALSDRAAYLNFIKREPK